MGRVFTEGASWIEGEIDGTGFGDARLGERLHKLTSQLDSALGQPIPLACEDWASTKAVYRILANGSVNEGPILAGHLRATARRTAASDGLILVLQDTTKFVYQRASPETIGFGSRPRVAINRRLIATRGGTCRGKNYPNICGRSS